MKTSPPIRYGVELVEFERDVVFKDRLGRRRSFWVHATISLFIHEEEDHVHPVGEPEITKLLRDCRWTFTEHDSHNLNEAIKKTAVKEYKKFQRKYKNSQRRNRH